MSCPLQRSIPCSRASPRTRVGVPSGQGVPPEEAFPTIGCPLPRDVPYDGTLAVTAAGCPTCRESLFWAQVCPGQVKALPLPVCKSGDPSRAVLLLTHRVPAGMRAMPRQQGPADPVTWGPLAPPIGCHAAAQK